MTMGVVSISDVLSPFGYFLLIFFLVCISVLMLSKIINTYKKKIRIK